MVKKRGARVAPPPREGEWALFFHDADAAEGWEDLCKQARGATRAAWEALTRAPLDRSNPSRQTRLRFDLGKRTIGGKDLEQWQYEVTGGGRIWYCPDPDKRVVLITHAGVGHPKAIDG